MMTKKRKRKAGATRMMMTQKRTIFVICTWPANDFKCI